jgi:hypothetical protein
MPLPSFWLNLYIRGMKLDLINSLKDEYHKALKSGEATPDGLMRLCILNWKKAFDIDEMRLAPVIDVALKNKESGRLWGGERSSIKSGLIMLAEHNADLFWEAMKDLLNEERMIIMRSNRFIHHCDIIFKDLKVVNQKINTHYQSYYSASLLLSLHHPENYCLFDFDLFENFCKRIEVQDLPVDTDLERYYKIVRTVYKIISKDEEFMNTYYSKLPADIYFGPSLSLVYDLMQFSKSKA